MSPTPDTGLVEETRPERPPRRPAPSAPASEGSQDEFSQYAQVEQQTIKRVLPLFRARVIYLGAERNHSKTLPGVVYVSRIEIAPGEFVETKEGKEGEATQVYDFSSHDNVGRLIIQRQWSATAGDPTLRNRPWLEIEHGEHLRWFLRQRDGRGNPIYAVLPHRDHKAAFNEYVMEKQRGEQAQEAFVEEIRTTM